MKTSPTSLIAAVAALACLSACGGGGTPAPQNGGTPPPETTPPVVTPPVVTPPVVTPPVVTPPAEPAFIVQLSASPFVTGTVVGGSPIRLLAALSHGVSGNIAWELAAGSPGQLVVPSPAPPPDPNSASSSAIDYVPPASGAGGTAVITARSGGQAASITFAVGPALPPAALTMLVPPGGLLANARDAVMDSKGNIFISDAGQDVIAKLTLDGALSVYAGKLLPALTPHELKDGPAGTATFSDVDNIALAADGTLYALDGSAGKALRKIGTDGSIATAAWLAKGFESSYLVSNGMAFDSAGNLYVTNNRTVRKLDTEGKVSTVAGECEVGGSHDGDVICKAGTSIDGTGANARFSRPDDIVLEASGNLLVNDGSLLRRVTPAGVVSTLPTTSAPRALVSDGKGSYLGIGDSGLWKLDANTGSLTLLAGALGVSSTLIKALPLPDGRQLLVFKDRVYLLDLR